MTVQNMAERTIPETIEAIINQLGGRGIRGALGYIEANKLTFRCAEMHGEYRAGRRSEVDTTGCPNFEVGLAFRVNGKPKRGWQMLVAYEPDDTYTVWLWQVGTAAQRAVGIMGEVLDKREDVYCDMLQSTVEQMYDAAIKKHNGGWINLS